MQKLIKIGGSSAETPGWYFRLAELLWEESKFFFFQANRRDDTLLELGKNADSREVARLQGEKADLERQSKKLQDQAVALYRAIVAKYPKYSRMDEVLFFLGETLMKRDRDSVDGLKAYRALIKNYPQSHFVPDAWMAFGEHYFELANKADRFGNLKKALESYRNATADKTSNIYGFAMYKQGWVHYNLGEWQEALDLFRAVILLGRSVRLRRPEGPQAGAGEGGPQGLRPHLQPRRDRRGRGRRLPPDRRRGRLVRHAEVARRDL